MRLATVLRSALAVLVLCAWAGIAAAQAIVEPIGRFAGWAIHDRLTQTTRMQPAAPSALPVVVYDNTASGAVGAISSTDLGATWGDQLATTGVGTLSEMAFTLFNSGSSAGPLLTCVVGIEFYDVGTVAFLGGFNVNFDFGGGLDPGYYTIGTVTGLEGLAIDLATTDLLVLQTVQGTSGAASRLGVALLDPVTVGSSVLEMYVHAATIGGPGWLRLDVPANPGYRLSVVTAPVPAGKSSWGRVKELYR